MQKRSNRNYKILFPIFLLFFAIISIQSGASLAKGLFPKIGVFGVTALRLFLATIILFLIFKPWRKKLNVYSLKNLIIYGISLGSMNLLFYLSLERIPLGIAVALEFTGPLSVAIFSSRKLIDFLWIFIVVIGLFFLLNFGDIGNNNLDLIGVFFALCAGTCWGIYIIFGKKAGIEHGSITVPLGSFISTLIYFPLGVIMTGFRSLFSLSTLPLSLAVAILSTAFPYTLEMFALTRIPSRTFGTLMSLEPAIGACIGTILLNENLTLTQWFSLFCIITASIGSMSTIRENND